MSQATTHGWMRLPEHKIYSTHTFYGIICSGLTDKTTLSFTSSNSSFAECVRNQSSYPESKSLYFSNDDINHDCPHYVAEGKCLYETDAVTLSDGGNYIFTDSEFNTCHNSGWGGAIDQIDGDLTIKRCIFDRCSCDHRGGAVSFRSSGTCIQEDNLYTRCWSAFRVGAFDSYQVGKNPTHHHSRCTYTDVSAQSYAIFCIEYSPSVTVESCRYINGQSQRIDYAGTVVNFEAQGAIVYLDCLFAENRAPNSGGLSFLGTETIDGASLSVKFCFFINNLDLDGGAYEIYFAHKAAAYANKDLIIHSFSATPNTKVFIENHAEGPDHDWLPKGTLSYLNTWDGDNDPYPDNDPDNPIFLSQISGNDCMTTSSRNLLFYSSLLILLSLNV